VNSPIWGLAQNEAWVWQVHAETDGHDPSAPPPPEILTGIRAQLRHRSPEEISLAIGWDGFDVLADHDRLELAVQHACRVGGLEAWRDITPQRGTVVAATNLTAGQVACMVWWGAAWGRMNGPNAGKATRVLTLKRARQIDAGLAALAAHDPDTDRWGAWCQAVDGFSFAATSEEWAGLAGFVDRIEHWHALGAASAAVLADVGAILEAAR